MQINYSGVDWVTATTREDKVGYYWWEIFTKWVALDDRESPFQEGWSNGYYNGVRCGGLCWGYRDGLGFILVASGSTAMWLWKELEPRPLRVTRLDICCDLLFATPIDLAGNAYTEIANRNLSGIRKYSLWQNTNGGKTLYVGSRHSMQFGRLYDKGNESGHAETGRLWRFEVEYKKPLSCDISNHLAQIEFDKLEREISNRVGAWFLERWVESGSELISAVIKPVLVQQRVSTLDKKLAWLRTQVSPTVHQLVEAGYGKDVLQSLLLDARAIEQINGLDLTNGP